MEPNRGKYAASNKDMFMKMFGGAKPAVKAGADASATTSGPPTATKPKGDDAAKKAQDEQRRKEREAYEREKAELEKKEQEERERKAKEEEEKKRKQQELEAEKQQKAAQEDQEDTSQTGQAAVVDTSSTDAKGATDGTDAMPGGDSGSDEQQQDQSPQEPDSSSPEQQAESPPDDDAEASTTSDTVGSTDGAGQAPSGKVHKCKAVDDYEAKKDGEISFKKGDSIFVVGQNLTARMLKGVCRGKTGYFPGHFVEDTGTGKRCGPPEMHLQRGVRCRALGNYSAKTVEELSFEQGDVIFIAVKVPGAKFWKGVRQGKAGLVPSKLVVDVEEEKKLNEAKAKVKVTRCRAIRPFSSPQSGWLKFGIGDIIIVPKATSDPIWQGVFKGNVGKFPADHVVDTEKYTPEEIEHMIEVQRSLVGDNTAVDDVPQAEVKPMASANEVSDPFSGAPAADPFASSSGSAPAQRQSDPFGPPARQKSALLPAVDASAFASLAGDSPAPSSEQSHHQQQHHQQPQHQQHQQQSVEDAFGDAQEGSGEHEATHADQSEPSADQVFGAPAPEEGPDIDELLDELNDLEVDEPEVGSEVSNADSTQAQASVDSTEPSEPEIFDDGTQQQEAIDAKEAKRLAKLEAKRAKEEAKKAKKAAKEQARQSKRKSK